MHGDQSSILSKSSTSFNADILHQLSSCDCTLFARFDYIFLGLLGHAVDNVAMFS